MRLRPSHADARSGPAERTAAHHHLLLLHRNRHLLLLVFLCFAGAFACKEEPPAPAEARLATDLPAATADQLLRSVVAQGGPRAERAPGLGLGASALPSLTEASAGPGTTPAAGKGAPAASTPGQSATSDVRWDLEPYGAIAAAAKGELLPRPATGEDVPDLWRDPGGTWVAVGGRAQVLLVATDRLGELRTQHRLLLDELLRRPADDPVRRDGGAPQ